MYHSLLIRKPNDESQKSISDISNRNENEKNEDEIEKRMSSLSSIFIDRSFRETGVIDTAFPYITLEDSLASALIIFNSEMLNQILVVDKNYHLFGVLDKASILREFTPPKSAIHSTISYSDKYLTQKTCEAIRSISKETLNDFSHIIHKTKSFRQEEFIFYGIKYFSRHSYLGDDLIAIVDDNLYVCGTVSGKNILKYLLRCIDLDSFSQDIGSALVYYPPSDKTLICLPNEPLENGLYAIDHTPVICVLIKKENKIVGLLTRETINEQIHPLYPELSNFPMDRFMRHINNFDILESKTNLKTVCQTLIESQDGFAIIESSRDNELKSNRNNLPIEYKVVSVISFIELIFSRFALHYSS